MTGVVSDNRAYLVLPLSGSGGQGNIEFVIDTGFTGVTTLPPAFCAALALPLARYQPSLLADSTSVLLEVYIATLHWDDKDREVEVLSLEGAPLIGTTLLKGYDLRLEIVDGGIVTIERTQQENLAIG